MTTLDRFLLSSASYVLAFVTACNERAPTRSADTVEKVTPFASVRPSSTHTPVIAAPAPTASTPSLAAPSPAPAPAPAPAPSAATLRDGGDAASAEPSLVASDGKPLPQTEDRPQADSPAFLERMRRLVTAIRTDDPGAARSAFFPVIAYEQVKAIAQPARDWERRLYAAFERNVHEYHRSLGESAGTLELVGVEVPASAVRWMKPGSEGNRVGYHRVLRSRLRVRDSEGRERALEITSMISWRGEWYVVHLHGFK